MYVWTASAFEGPRNSGIVCVRIRSTTVWIRSTICGGAVACDSFSSVTYEPNVEGGRMDGMDGSSRADVETTCAFRHRVEHSDVREGACTHGAGLPQTAHAVDMTFLVAAVLPAGRLA